MNGINLSSNGYTLLTVIISNGTVATDINTANKEPTIVNATAS